MPVLENAGLLWAKKEKIFLSILFFEIQANDKVHDMTKNSDWMFKLLYQQVTIKLNVSHLSQLLKMKYIA